MPFLQIPTQTKGVGIRGTDKTGHSSVGNTLQKSVLHLMKDQLVLERDSVIEQALPVSVQKTFFVFVLSQETSDVPVLGLDKGMGGLESQLFKINITCIFRFFGMEQKEWNV